MAPPARARALAGALALALAAALALATGADAQAAVALNREAVLTDLPLHKGFVDGKPLYFVVTDGSSAALNTRITEAQGWRVEGAPPLASAPAGTVSPVYTFTNGVKGKGFYGFQPEVFTTHPGAKAPMPPYTALTRVMTVKWMSGQTPTELTSAAAVMDAAKAGKVEVADSKAVLNTPQIVWPGGKMMVRPGPFKEDGPYNGGQVTKIDMDAMKVTFIAHRGFGPRGETIYYIVTDATPEGPAKMMGVVYSPALAKARATPAAPVIWQFANGLKGAGPMGFQPGIAEVAPGSRAYSPLWSIFMVEHKDPKTAGLLMTAADVEQLEAGGMGKAMEARPDGKDHVVNCPFLDPFQAAA